MDQARRLWDGVTGEPRDPLNAGIAARFDEVARILADQNANPYRISAYRAAARTIRNCPEPISPLIKEHGVAGLRMLPTIGVRLARSTYQLATTAGRLPSTSPFGAASEETSMCWQPEVSYKA